MSTFWHWFVVAGTALSLVFVLWLLMANRTTGGDNSNHEWDGIQELDNPLPAWWVGMFVGSVFFAVLYLIFYPGMGNFSGAGNWSSVNQHDVESMQHTQRFEPLYQKLANMPLTDLIGDKQGMQVGRRLFINNCATCHGVNASGAPGFPNLTDTQWLWGGTYADIQHSITAGRQAQMPPWGQALGEEGVSNVAHYVRQLANLEHQSESAQAGENQYAIFCVACHGTQGKGNTLLGAPDLTNNIWLYGSALTDIAQSISSGRTGNMPSHQGNLGPQRIKILAAYVKSLEK